MKTSTIYRIDYDVITPSNTRRTLSSDMDSNGYSHTSLDEVYDTIQRTLKKYASNGYKVLSYEIFKQTITYSDWKQYETQTISKGTGE